MSGRGAMAVALAVAAAVAGCRATTPRPPFVPFPEAAHAEIGFGNPDPLATIVRATRTVADALRADSIPIRVVHEEAGFLESPWFDAATLAPTTRRRLGPDVVRVRAWVGPAKPGYSALEVETVFRPRADPSLPERELESPVPDDHPVGRRVAEVVKRLAAEFGDPDAAADSAARQVRPAGPPPVAQPPGPPPPRPRPDTTRLR